MKSPITNQDEFNKFVARMMRDLYDVTVISPHTIAAGEPEAEDIRNRSDEQFRHDLQAIDEWAFRREYASMPSSSAPPVAD